MALITRLGEPFTGNLAAQLPKIPIFDPIESPGSLLLLDLTHPALPMDETRSPVECLAYPNVLRGISGLSGPEALYLTTSGAETATAPSVADRTEWTARGGLHVMNAQHSDASYSADTAVNKGVYSVLFGSDLTAYMATHPGHNYYVSVWMRETRAPGPNAWSVGVEYGGMLAGVQTDRFFFSFAKVGDAFAARFNYRTATFDGNCLFTCASGTNTFTGTGSDDPANYRILSDRKGAFNASSYNPQNLPSLILYRAYVEDLTISGRTATEVEAIDRSLYEKELLTAGGRYHGDSWTDPTILDP